MNATRQQAEIAFEIYMGKEGVQGARLTGRYATLGFHGIAGDTETLFEVEGANGRTVAWIQEDGWNVGETLGGYVDMPEE
ncbi:hypothetical protein AB0395_34890 [Streptosporangium sp. NPDC051023]|uniref:hypothetical protein n=1 Tax=Streptosporangium sp. NPDC051023 TaxID=3155410 RepID=UPI00344D52D2